MAEMKLLAELIKRAKRMEEANRGEAKIWFQVPSGGNSHTRQLVDLSLVRWLSEQMVDLYPVEEDDGA